MIISMHGLVTMHSNMRTDIRMAGELGYDALEVVETKLLRYLDNGYKAEDLLPLYEAAKIRPMCINALKDVEVVEPAARKDLFVKAGRLITAAAAMKCPVIQLVPFCALEGRPESEVIGLTAKNVAEIADMGKAYGIKFQIEPIAWAPIHSLSQSLKLMDSAGRDNVGVVIDFWHLSAGEATTYDEVAKLDKSIIHGIHFCDGKLHVKGTVWNEGALRGYLPGDGDLPIKEWVAAVKATGYDGCWSSEMYSPYHWEWDLTEMARISRERMLEYIR
jgi:sugar phosphate isomerase/epimerase